jgi:hypothetical protein
LKKQDKVYDVIVVGGGPAGMMAAIQAAKLERSVLLIEKNNSLGKKLLITGSGRCNVTNTAHLNDFTKRFGKHGAFLRSAFSSFSNMDLMDFFKSKGLDLKIEDSGRVFPVTDDSKSILNVLKEFLKENNVKIMYNASLAGVKKTSGGFRLNLNLKNDEVSMNTKKVVLATGGASYRATGSAGDGFVIAEKLGHKITPLKPGSVPLKVKEAWVEDLQGISLENVGLTFKSGKKRISNKGDVIFTQFGVSGPKILDLSARVISFLEKEDEIPLLLDLKPDLGREELGVKLVEAFKIHGKTDLKNFMKFLMPNRMIPIFLKLSNVDSKKKLNQINKKERNSILNLLKAFPLKVTGCLPLEKAMVTCGGVSKKEINPQTMESKLVPGLYFAGEIIDGCAPSGGYNLQQAFSTGYLAGRSAAC